MMKFIKDENGQGMLEYVLIIALVVIAVVAIIVALRNYIKNKDIVNNLNNMEAQANKV